MAGDKNVILGATKVSSIFVIDGLSQGKPGKQKAYLFSFAAVFACSTPGPKP